MVSIQVSPVNFEYLTVATQDSKGFDAEITALLPAGVSEQALKLKPYLFVITNHSQRTVVAYILKFVFSFDNGSKVVQYSRLADPTAALTQTWTVTGQYEVLVPGRQRVVSVSMVLNSEPRFNQPETIPNYKEFIDQQVPPEHLRHMEIEANAVIFEDGYLSGPDDSDLAADFAGSVAGLRALIGKIVNEVDAGHSLESVFGQVGDEVHRKVRQHVIDTDRTSEAYTLASAVRLWKRMGDEAFLNQARAVLKSPTFRVWRTQ